MRGLNRGLVIAGAALAVTGAALSQSPASDSPTEYGAVPQQAAPSATASVGPPAGASVRPSVNAAVPPPAAVAGRPRVDGSAASTGKVTAPGRVSSPAPAVLERPTRLTVSSIGTAASVVPVGVRQDGSLELPTPSQVGWWQGGAAPGAARGSVVLAGHVDTAEGNHGSLYNLSAIPPGATIRLATRTKTFTYKVVALRTYPKQALPRSLFDRTTAGRLVLITCGGPYDHGYTRNVVAYAVPLTP
jgi:hypothetical protein